MLKLSVSGSGSLGKFKCVIELVNDILIIVLSPLNICSDFDVKLQLTMDQVMKKLRIILRKRRGDGFIFR